MHKFDSNTSFDLNLPVVKLRKPARNQNRTSWPSWLRRKTVNLEIVSSILTEVVIFFLILLSYPIEGCDHPKLPVVIDCDYS